MTPGRYSRPLVDVEASNGHHIGGESPPGGMPVPTEGGKAESKTNILDKFIQKDVLEKVGGQTYFVGRYASSTSDNI